jgi:copper chaperone NosL
MKKPLISILLALLIICAASRSPALGAEPAGPGPKDRCAVCGMFVAGYANWIATIVFKDGSQVFFDGPKDMFVYFFDLEKYAPAKTDADLQGLYVTEYYSTRLVDARKVYFVIGSDVMGPMGQELIPVADLAQARTFFRDHHGKKIRQFDGSTLVDVPASQ